MSSLIGRVRNCAYTNIFVCRFHPKGVIIETTGLADPAPVVQTFFVDETISEMYTLDSVITVVDAKEILDRLAEEKP